MHQKSSLSFWAGIRWGAGLAVVAAFLYSTNSLLFHPYEFRGGDMGPAGSFLVGMAFVLPFSALAGAVLGAVVVALLKTGFALQKGMKGRRNSIELPWGLIIGLVGNAAIFGLYEYVQFVYQAGPDVNTDTLDQRLDFNFLIAGLTTLIGLPLSVVEWRDGNTWGGILGALLSLCTLPLAYFLRACFSLASG